jgi:hypothetical protein
MYLEHVRWGPLSPQHGTSTGNGRRDGQQKWRVAVNILNRQPWANDKGCSSRLVVGCGANNPSPYKTSLLQKVIKSPGPGQIL